MGGGDAYTKRLDDATQGIVRKCKYGDDPLLYDSNIEEDFWHTDEFLATCTAKRITQKAEKFQITRRKVDFVVYVSVGTSTSPRRLPVDDLLSQLLA